MAKFDPFGLGCALLAILSGPLPSADSAEPPAQASPSNHVTIPFEFRRGHVMVPARINGSNTISLLLDTGYGVTMLNGRNVDALGLRRTGQISIVGIAGEEPAGMFEGPALDFGGMPWKPRRVAAFPADQQGRARRGDGILGSGFFRRFVVAINPRGKTITLHEPDGFNYSGPGEILPLTFKGSTPIVEATVRLPDLSEVKVQFEIDTGCDDALCLGKHFVAAHQLAPTNNASNGSRFGVGGSTLTHTGRLPGLQLGKLAVENLAANFFLEGSPVDPPLAGHIGWELLRKFKVTFDYSRKRMVLERNVDSSP